MSQFSPKQVAEQQLGFARLDRSICTEVGVEFTVGINCSGADNDKYPQVLEFVDSLAEDYGLECLGVQDGKRQESSFVFSVRFVRTTLPSEWL